MANLAAAVKAEARALGFEVAAIASAAPLEHDLAALWNWCDAGFAAGMNYMTRRPELHGNPKILVPSAVSIITLAVNYHTATTAFFHENRFGRVARYAWGQDYHEVVRPKLVELGERISRIAGRPVKYRCFVDAVPLLERAVAARAGIGFFGKNTNLIRPKAGSWFFLSEILIDLELDNDKAESNVGCGTCIRCLNACPTAAFAGPHRLDSRRCISYLTIENKGAIPRELRAGVGEWIFGCDVCQDVCPFNRFSSDTHWAEFRPSAGAGSRLDLIEVLSIASDSGFRARFAGTALLRPKRRGLLRNAAVVAANIDCAAAVPMLVERVEHDPEPVIRAHALWALSRLDRRRSTTLAERVMRSDEAGDVREEAEQMLLAG